MVNVKNLFSKLVVLQLSANKKEIHPQVTECITVPSFFQSGNIFFRLTGHKCAEREGKVTLCIYPITGGELHYVRKS